MAKRNVDITISAKDKASRAFGQVNRSTGRLRKSFLNLKTAALSALGGYALIRGIQSVIMANAEFEKSLAMVSTMLEGPATKAVAQYRKQIDGLAISLGQSTETLAKGLYDLLSARVAPEEAVRALEANAKAAVAGMTDVATATKAAVRVMRSYGLQASQTADIHDLLFTVVKQAVINYNDLAESIAIVAPTAQAAGLSLEELGAAVATVVSIEEPKRGMTALRTALYEAAEAGMDLISFVRSMKGATLGDIIGAGIPKKAAQGILILANNIELLDENLEAMTRRTGATNTAFVKMTTGAGKTDHRLRQMQQRVEKLKRSIGAGLTPAVMELLERINKLTAGLQEMTAKEMQDLIDKVIFAAQAIVAMWAGSKIIAAAGVFMGLIQSATAAVGAFGVAAVIAQAQIVGLLAAIGVGAYYGGKWALTKLFNIDELEAEGEKLRDIGKTIGELNKELAEAPRINLATTFEGQIAAATKRAELLSKMVEATGSKAFKAKLKATQEYLAETKKRQGAEAAAAMKEKAAADMAAKAKMKAAAFAATWMQKIRVLRARAIKNDLKREIALVKLRYEQEIKAARKAGQQVGLIRKAMGIEIETLVQKAAAERAAAAKAEAPRPTMPSLAPLLETRFMTMRGRGAAGDPAAQNEKNTRKIAELQGRLVKLTEQMRQTLARLGEGAGLLLARVRI